MAAEHGHGMTPHEGAQPGAGAHAGRPDQAGHVDPAHAEHEHASIKTYLLIGLILTVITAAEVAIFYIPAIADTSWLAPILITMSLGKFVLVVMYYMHLKFDSRIFSSVFVAPLILAVTVVISLIILFKVLPTYL
mgnify:CR=1 FL=1